MKFGTGVYALGAVAATALFGAGNVFMKVAYEGFDPLWCAALRFGIATLLLGALFGARTLAALRSVSLRCWLVPSVCMAGCFLTAALSVNYTSATTAGFFFALPLLFAPGLAYALQKQRIGARTVSVQIAVLFGLYLLCCGTGTLSFGIGEALGLASSALLAGALVTGERFIREADAISLSVAQVGTAFVIAIPLAITCEPAPSFEAVAVRSWVAVAALGTLSAGLAFLLQNIALEKISSTTSSVIVCAEPIFTAVLAALFLGEGLTAMGMVGGAVIVACTLVSSLPEGFAGATLAKASTRRNAHVRQGGMAFTPRTVR